MVQGRQIDAEIEAPAVVEIPRARKTVEISVRLTLTNRGDGDFVAHARSADDRHFWHVFDEHFQEVLREPGKGKGGGGVVRTKRGVHSYRTETVPSGQGIHAARKLVLDATKLEEGGTYTVRGEYFGHVAEARFVAVREAPPAALRALKKKKGKKQAAKTRAAKTRAAKKKAPKKAVKKKAKKKTAKRAKKAGKARKAAKKAARKVKKAPRLAAGKSKRAAKRAARKAKK